MRSRLQSITYGRNNKSIWPLYSCLFWVNIWCLYSCCFSECENNYWSAGWMIRCSPWPKFLCIKGVVFMTYWQSLVLDMFGHIGILQVLESHIWRAHSSDCSTIDCCCFWPSEHCCCFWCSEHCCCFYDTLVLQPQYVSAIQNFLICIEMFVAAVFHFFVFPPSGAPYPPSPVSSPLIHIQFRITCCHVQKQLQQVTIANLALTCFAILLWLALRSIWCQQPRSRILTQFFHSVPFIFWYVDERKGSASWVVVVVSLYELYVSLEMNFTVSLYEL